MRARRRRLPGLRAAVLVFLVAACSSGPAPVEPPREAPPPVDPLDGLEPWSDAWIVAHAPSYLEDRVARRAALEASLTRPENLYSETRLGSYALERGGWDALPEWSPHTAPVDGAMATALAAGAPVLLPESAARIEAVVPTDWDGWVALGARVFSELPLRAEPFVEVAVRSPDLGAALGVERAADGSIPGIVVLRDIDGRDALGITCALCHSARVGDTFVMGRARRTLDYGRLRIAAFEHRGRPLEDATRARYESWGPGRADVLEETSEVPIAIPDLWGLRHERFLTQAGTLTHASPLTLAIRQETQYVQANHLHTRPPRVLAFALAVYLYSLEPPPARPAEEGSEPGAIVFARECGRCHSSRIGSGDLVDAVELGTDTELALGRARGTGRYRPAPLVRVADAAPYFHHGAVPSLEDLLSSDRLAPGYTRSPAGPGPVPGHPFGLELSSEDRAALLAHLRSR